MQLIYFLCRYLESVSRGREICLLGEIWVVNNWVDHTEKATIAHNYSNAFITSHTVLSVTECLDDLLFLAIGEGKGRPDSGSEQNRQFVILEVAENVCRKSVNFLCIF